MNIYENKSNWIIEDYLDLTLIEEIKNFIDENINIFYKFKEGYSTKGKNCEQYWFTNTNKNFTISSSKFNLLKIKYTNEVLNKIKKSNLISKSLNELVSLTSLSSWTVIGEEGSYHAAHNHSLGKFDEITTVLYLQVPQTNLPTETENNLFLVTNSFPNNLVYASNIPSTTEINPEIGKLLIFPSWIVHGTYPQTKGIRQTFNIDYKINIKNDNIYFKNFNYF